MPTRISVAEAYAARVLTWAGIVGLVAAAGGWLRTRSAPALCLVAALIVLVVLLGIWGRRIGRRQRARAGAQRDARQADARLAINARLAPDVEIRGFPGSDPDVQPARPAEYCLPRAVSAAASAVRESGTLTVNEPHALVAADPADRDPSFALSYRVADYAAILALRDRGVPFPPIITANVLACCARRDTIFVLRRSDDVATHPGSLTIAGGNYKAPPAHDNDGGSLRRTAERELAEEMGLRVRIPDDCVRVSARQGMSGGTEQFWQLNFLGVDIDPADADLAGSSSEGHVLPLSMKKLAAALLDPAEKWVPAGRAAVLLWLALGAPMAGGSRGFDPTKARRVFDAWVASTPASVSAP